MKPAARWIAVLALSCALFFSRLGSLPFYTKGEPREAVQVWDEVNRSEWILPLRNGVDLPSKPPLFHWLGGAASVANGEVNELSCRLPSAVLATFSVLLVLWLGAKKWGPAAGVYAALILATNFEWMRAATTSRVDMTLTAFLIGALVALDRITAAPQPTTAQLAGFYVCMGLAALGKGPVGILLPALVTVVYLGARGDVARLRRMRVIAGGLFAVVIASWWYALAIAHAGWPFVQKQILVENFGRFFSAGASGAGHQHPFYYLVGGFFAGFFPWSAFLPSLAIYLHRCRGRLESRGYLYPLVWFLTVFVFYSISQSKRTVYILPVYPAASLLLGAWWHELADKRIRPSRAMSRALMAAAVAMMVVVLLAGGLLLGTMLGGKPMLALAPLLKTKDLESLPLVQEILHTHLSILGLWVAVLVPVCGLFLYSARTERWANAFAAILALVVTTVPVVGGIFQEEIAARRTFRPFMEEVRETVKSEDAVYFYQTFDYGAVFYARRRIPTVGDDFGPPPSPGRSSYLLTWESVWQAIPAERKSALELVRVSEGAGPKGRDRLVLARVLAPGAASSAVQAGPSSEPDDSEE
jgi:4-amino-4-deoxy-L-arabinose transferase-like glycosyltransferase